LSASLLRPLRVQLIDLAQSSGRPSPVGIGFNKLGGKTRSARLAMRSLDVPYLAFIIALAVQCAAIYGGRLVRDKIKPLSENQHKDFDVVQAATLTLLALIIGFSFSMSITRYDQRKNYEEAEANAIGTEYVRADLLPTEDAARTRQLLRKYLDRRIAFYLARDSRSVDQIDLDTQKLQAELWSAILPAAKAEPTQVMALAVSGMNDVLNSQSYTQAAWWNRIPLAAWVMMGLMAAAANVMVGYGARRNGAFLFVLPIVISISFLLIAYIDSPRGGIIRLLPQNLLALSQSLAP
jgi:hypothetical protein